MSRLLLIVLAACAMFMASASAQEPVEFSGELSVIHAGSLSVPFAELSELFMAKHPGVTVLAEAHGSRDCARKVSELEINYDVMGSADYSVIDTLLIPDHAAYAIRFATNEMAIVYTERSLYSDEITAENWPQVLLRDDVAFGRADPNRDPCGYRTVMTFQLAEKQYDIPGLAAKLTEKDGQKYIRPKETDLLALLEAGEIDYLFIYRSVGEQHSLNLLLLPDEVNLKRAELADLYATATVELTGKEPGEFITQTGAPMVYGITMPFKAEQQEMALAYIALLLSPEGQAIMEGNGQPSINPAYCEQYDALPDMLKPLCTGPDV